jgi:hypothetical protein
MIQFTTSKGEYVVVEVPKGSFNCWVKCGLQIRNLLCSVPTNEPNRITTNVELLLSGINYTFICTTDNISEEVAASIVEIYEQVVGWRLDGDLSKMSKLILFCNYNVKIPTPVSMLCDTALDSFKSLLQSLGLSLDKNYAICKKN